MRRFGIIVTVAVLSSLLAASQSHADSINWTGTTGDWHDPLNWSSGIPTSSDDAYIDNDGTAQISPDAESSRLYAGNYNSGAVEQTGGTHAVDGRLYLGYHSGSSGTYNLSGTAQLSVNWDEYIGFSGTGEFNQDGGTNTVGDYLRLGYGIGSSGTYNLSAGELSAKYEYIGYNGTGEFNQDGGTNTVGSYLHLDGTYNLSAGELSAGYEYIGRYGTGAFNQDGGTNTVGYLYVKDNSSYTLSSGTLFIGDSTKINGSFHFDNGDGALNVNGGLANFTDGVIDGTDSASFTSAANTLTIFPTGFDPAAQFGSYNALGLVHNAGSTLVISAGEGFTGCGWIGDHVQNRGNIVASGGSLDFRGGLTISDGGTLDSSNYDFTVGNGTTVTIAASGGELTVGSREYIGYEGTGEFNQTGGTHSVSSILHIGYLSGSSGTYNQTGGINTVGNDLYLGCNTGSSGIYNFLDGELFVHGDIRVNYGYFTDTGALNSGEIYLGGHFINQSEESELFSMVHTSLTIWGGEEEQPGVLDMNSIDYGTNCAGLVDNFALGTLVFEGNPVGTSTCYRLDSDVYTYGLALNEGAHLDLNGHTLYYVPLGHSYYGISPSTFFLGGTWVNGDITAIIPEPATIMLIGAGLLGLAGLARRKYRSIGV